MLSTLLYSYHNETKHLFTPLLKVIIVRRTLSSDLFQGSVNKQVRMLTSH